MIARVPDAVGVMDELCAAYRDPVTGENSCAQIQRDKRCQLDDTLSLHEGIATALAFTHFNSDPTATEHARAKLWAADIVSLVRSPASSRQDLTAGWLGRLVQALSHSSQSSLQRCLNI